MIKGMLFAFLAAFSWGAAIVMSKKGVEELDAGGVFFWQICSAVILSWIVLFIKRKKLPLNSKAILAYAANKYIFVCPLTLLMDEQRQVVDE